jgi:histidine phosphatase superfamily protein (branch 2)
MLRIRLKLGVVVIAVAAVIANARLWAAPPLRLRYVIIVIRHGVRSPTWSLRRLNQYSAEPWPDWGVTAGDLTPHGRTLMRLMGTYYRDRFAREGLLTREGCADAGRIYIRADADQRTVETGRALAESLAPGCTIPVHSRCETRVRSRRRTHRRSRTLPFRVAERRSGRTPAPGRRSGRSFGTQSTLSLRLPNPLKSALTEGQSDHRRITISVGA